MRLSNLLQRFVLFCALCAVGTWLSAQTNAEMDRLSADLCGCMQQVDPRSSDAVVQAEVRRCLEDAVVYHPATVGALLKRQGAEADRALRLGQVMGALLERDCPWFGPIKARLRSSEALTRGRSSM